MNTRYPSHIYASTLRRKDGAWRRGRRGRSFPLLPLLFTVAAGAALTGTGIAASMGRLLF